MGRIFLLGILFSFGIFAAIGTPSGKKLKTIDESGEQIELFNELAVKPEKELSLPAAKLKLTGSGIRVKKKFIFTGNAYFAAHYSDKPELIQKTNPMAGLQKNKLRVIKLTFLRDVGADTIKESFKESLKANKVPMESPAIEEIFKHLTFDMPKGKTLTLVSYESMPELQVLTIQGPETTFSVNGVGVGDNFWKIWFGEPVDDGLANLKNDLLNQLKDAKST